MFLEQGAHDPSRGAFVATIVPSQAYLVELILL
jgi:hypothetical protein